MSKGLGGFLKGVSKAIDNSVDYLENQAAPYVGAHRPGASALLNLFATGNVLYLRPNALASRGTTLQIVMGPDGQLSLDGMGGMTPNAQWTIINEGHNKIRLHNQNNFIAVKNKNLCLVNVPMGAPAGVESQFYISQNGQHIHLASVGSPGVYVAIGDNGHPNPTATTFIYRNMGVQLVFSPYGASPYGTQAACAAPQPGPPPPGAPGMAAAPPPAGAPQHPGAPPQHQLYPGMPPPQAGAAPPVAQPPAMAAPPYQEKGGVPPPYQP